MSTITATHLEQDLATGGSGLATVPKVQRNGSPRRHTVNDVVIHGLALLAFVWALFPLLFIVSAAINPSGTLDTSSLIPTRFSLANFKELFTHSTWAYGSWALNSLIVCVANGLIAVFIGSCAAYAFSRLRFRGRRFGLGALLLLQMFPGILAFLALYLTFAKIGDVLPQLGLNTLAGLILAYAGGAMGGNVWLLKGYFDTIPKELDEAAKVDGASHARIFFTITLPLVAPILVTVFMLSFIGTFSEFLLAGIFLQDVDKQTMAVGLRAMLMSDRMKYFGPFCAGALLASLPVMALYLSFQKQLTGGLTAGSVK